MKLSEMAMAAAQFSQKKARTSAHDYPSEMDDYPGVIVTTGSCRLAVSPYGRAYLAQVWQDGSWRTGRPFASQADLAFHLKFIDEPWPAEILAVLADLPDDPAECAAGLLSGKDAG